MKHIVFAATLSLASVTGLPTQAAGFDHATRTGVVYLDEAGAPHLEIQVDPLAGQRTLDPGTAVTVVIFSFDNDGEQRLVQARIAGAPLAGAEEPGRIFVNGAPVKTTGYALEITGKAALYPGSMGVGIADVEGRCGLHGAVVQCTLEPDEAPQSFRVCASGEGLHFTVWSGKPLIGARLWRTYYYLGYDMEANCTPEDYEG